MVRQFFERLRLGTLVLGGFIMMIFGAAGYATFAEGDHECKPSESKGVYTLSTHTRQAKY